MQSWPLCQLCFGDIVWLMTVILVSPFVWASGLWAVTGVHPSSSAAQRLPQAPGVSPHAVSSHMSYAPCPAHAELEHP